MVMEFSDNMLNLDGHQINGAQLKQFVQVRRYRFKTPQTCVLFKKQTKDRLYSTVHSHGYMWASR